MLCYAMLLCGILCYAMLGHVLMCYVMLCYVMLCRAMPCFAMLCYVSLRTLRYDKLHYVSYVMLRNVVYMIIQFH
jgi:hypothetical protein